MSKRNAYKIPFDKHGNQLVWVKNETEASIEWRDNTPFWTTLVYDGITTGRSAVRGNFKVKETGASVNMFLTEFSAIISKLNAGEVTGRFHFEKRGANYGIVMLETTPLEQLAIQAD